MFELHHTYDDTSCVPDEVYELSPGLNTRKLLQASKGFFVLRDKGTPIMGGGLISTSLVSGHRYVWLVGKDVPTNYTKVRLGLRIAHRWLEFLGADTYAETAVEDVTSNKFVLACGFRLIETAADRNLYKWIK